MEFSILENVFYPKIIHLYASIFQVFALNNYLCASWLKYFFFTWKCPLSKEYMPLCECFSIFLLKIIYLCASWLKWHFYTEKYFPPAEYTPLTKKVLYTFENLIYPKNIHFCMKVLKVFYQRFSTIMQAY